jgi:hypothetical protein
MKLLGAKLRGVFAKFSEAFPPSLPTPPKQVASAAKAGRQGYGGFSSPSSSQQAARHSAKGNKRVLLLRRLCRGPV